MVSLFKTFRLLQALPTMAMSPKQRLKDVILFGGVEDCFKPISATNASNHTLKIQYGKNTFCLAEFKYKWSRCDVPRRGMACFLVVSLPQFKKE